MTPDAVETRGHLLGISTGWSQKGCVECGYTETHPYGVLRAGGTKRNTKGKVTVDEAKNLGQAKRQVALQSR